MITGRDEMSLQVIKMLNENMKHQEIAEILGISINNIKRLSRYNNMLIQANEHLQERSIKKIQELGLKILPLTSLFKNKDYKGLDEILIDIPNDIKRSEINSFIKALEKKRDVVKDIKKRATYEIERLKREEEKIEEEIQEIQVAIEKKKLVKRILKDLDPKEKELLQDYLGFHKGNIALKRKIHTNWDAELSRNKIIEHEYDTENYAWYDLTIILDIEKFIKSLQNRLSSKEKINFYKKFYWRTIISFDANLKKIVAEKKKELEEVFIEREKSINRLQEAENIAITKYLNIKDEYKEYKIKEKIELQRALKKEAIKYLYDHGYAAIDIEEGAAAYNQEKNIIIIDTRIYDEELVYDDKWKRSLNKCNQLYLIYNKKDYYFDTPIGIRQKRFFEDIESNGVGIIQYKQTSKKIELEVVHEAQIRELTKKDSTEVVFQIARKISKHMIFG
jgi:hypothetical protein